jgi:hypothetical protein
MRATRKYTTAYKKKVDVERDTYQPKKSPPGTLQYRGCGAFYYRRRWSLEPPSDPENRAQTEVHPVFCPACLKIRDRYPSGELRLSGVGARERRELMHILRNEEAHAREKNPLERIIAIEANGAQGWSVTTTTEKLAQRLGRCLRKGSRRRRTLSVVA